MKRVILYGCGLASVETRRNIEFFIDKSYEIIGYIDGKYNYNALDNKNYFRFDELHNIDFDYILLCSKRELTLEKMLNRLIDNGVDRKRVLAPLLFMDKSAERSHIDLINDLNNCYSGEPNLIFGMSYAYTDLILKSLKTPFYRCCCPGMDLYYSFKVYKYMYARGLIKKANAIVLMFAYDHFHYDMSRSQHQYSSGNIFSLWRLDDWHNAEFFSDAWEYIENYRLFAKRISSFYYFGQFDYQNSEYYNSNSDGDGILENIWFQNHEKTVIENMNIYKMFIEQMKKDGAKPVVVVPPYYLSGMDALSKKAFKEKRDEFYRILHDMKIETGNTPIYDYSNLFKNQRKYFSDLIHLNSAGAKKFTQIINEDVVL